jgi:hypothetical protein
MDFDDLNHKFCLALRYCEACLGMSQVSAGTDISMVVCFSCFKASCLVVKVPFLDEILTD